MQTHFGSSAPQKFRSRRRRTLKADQNFRDEVQFSKEGRQAAAQEEQEEMAARNDEILSIISELGGSAKGYARERRTAVDRIIAEVYPAPRITAAAKLLPHLGILPGFALDRTTNGEDGAPWDFSLQSHRQSWTDSPS